MRPAQATRSGQRIDGSGGDNAERLPALAAALLVPLLLASLLRIAPGPPVTRTPALQLVWIEAPTPAAMQQPPADLARHAEPAAPPSAAPLPSAADDGPRAARSHVRPLQVVDIAAEPAAAEAGAQAGAHDLLEQARRAATADGNGADFRQNLLENRATAHDRVAAGRFAMRREITPQDVVEGIGVMLFGGSPDPCPEIRDDVRRHALDPDNRERLEEALRRERAGNCR